MLSPRKRVRTDPRPPPLPQKHHHAVQREEQHRVLVEAPTLGMRRQLDLVSATALQTPERQALEGGEERSVDSCFDSDGDDGEIQRHQPIGDRPSAPDIWRRQ